MPNTAATYATLDDARREAFNTDASVTDGDADLVRALRFVTARIDAELPNCRFLPLSETRYYSARDRRLGGDVDGYDLLLNGDLLSLVSVTNGDGAVLTAEEYTLYPREGAPYTRVRLNLNGSQAWTTDANGDPEGAIQVAGVWATGSRLYGDWATDIDTLSAAISTITATAITLTWSADTDWRGAEPRFSVGQRIRIDSEYMDVLAASSANKTLTVLRGTGGTTAATHLSGASVAVWEVDPIIRHAAARWAGYAFKRRGAFADSQFDAGSGINTRFPKDVPPDVEGDLSKFRPRHTGARMVAI